MSKTKWRNLWHSYRALRRVMTPAEAMLYISHFNRNDAAMLHRVVKGTHAS